MGGSLLILAVSLVLVSVPASEGRSRGACQPKGADVIGRSPLGRVYELKNRGTWACTTRFGRSYQFVDPCCLDEADPPFAFSGRFFAVAIRGCEPTSDQCGSGIAVINMSSGRYRRPFRRTSRNPGCVDLCADNVQAIVLKRNASMAWVVKAAQPAATLQLLSVDPTGRRLLDSGDGIEPRSLRLCRARERVCWVSNGKHKSAPLP